MKYCEKCRVHIKGGAALCPLCQNKLSGPAEDELYPVIPTIYKQHELFFKLCIFSTVVAGVISAAVNLMLPESGNWSVYVALGIVCFWISLTIAIKKRSDIPNNITNQVVIITVLSVGWDYITGWRGWSLDYFIPIAFIAAMVSLAIVAKVMRLPIGDYFLYLFVDIIFGIVPFILYLSGVLHTAIPSIICIAVSIMSFAALLLFEGKFMRLELSRRFHL